MQRSCFTEYFLLPYTYKAAWGGGAARDQHHALRPTTASQSLQTCPFSAAPYGFLVDKGGDTLLIKRQAYTWRPKPPPRKQVLSKALPALLQCRDQQRLHVHMFSLSRCGYISTGRGWPVAKIHFRCLTRRLRDPSHVDAVTVET